MTRETLIAVFENARGADEAIVQLRAIGVDQSDIERHDQSSIAQHHSTRRKGGFWNWLFGRNDDDTASTDAWDRSVKSGSVVVTVTADSDEAEALMDLLSRYNPVDIDEREAGTSTRPQPANVIETDAGARGQAQMAAQNQPPQTGRAAPQMQAENVGEQVIPLAEERLVVGKRPVNRGTTRIHRYVIERPVEETLNLMEERVEVQRRPVAGSAGAPADSFAERTVEVTEMAEEPVVAKTAQVAEEVVVRKGAQQRQETVRDTVRREEVDVEKAPTTQAGAPGGGTTDRAPGTKQRPR